MAQLPIDEAIVRFKDNEDKFDIFVNLDGTYTTNEVTPRTVQTLPSFMDEMVSRYYAYSAKGAWTTATAYERQDLVVEGGVTYLCLLDHTSTTFATDLSSGKWAVYQGLTREELLNSTDPVEGAGQVGFDDMTLYSSNTVGKAVKDRIKTSSLSVNNNINDGSKMVGFYDTIAPAYLKTLSDIGNGLPVNFFRFVPQNKVADLRSRTNNDVLDSYFADALASGCLEINFEPGLYHTASSIAMGISNQHLKGAGWGRSEIRIASTTASAITLANGVSGYGLSGFKISRTGTPTSSALGVEFLGTTDDSLLEDLWIEGHFTNLKIGTCDTGKIRRLRLNKALAYGCYQTNAASYGPSQWDVDDVLFDRNTVDGWRIQSTNGPAGLILGPMRNVKSFANGGRGIHILGSNTTPVYDIRINDAFLGSDGLGSIRLDTYGGKHRISGFFERNGRDSTGPALATAATNTAPGIEMSTNNVDLVIYGSTIDDNSYDGIQHDGGILTVVASHIYNNGAASTAGRRNGVLSNGGKLVVGSDVICNAASIAGGSIGSSQLYGIATSHDNAVIAGNDLNNNATAAASLGATTNASVIGNSPSALTTRIPSTIDVVKFNSAYTPTAAGGDKGAGTVNVAAGLFKNNTAYSNP